ncbi:MAG: hypothetical protein EAZ08_04435 [Cytophagales bacterium]|nr:MAG: hypothetical protein EAZ08_04435 [Cytophagales bacterium]
MQRNYYDKLNTAIVLFLLVTGFILLFTPYTIYQTNIISHLASLMELLGLPKKDFPTILYNFRISKNNILVFNSGILFIISSVINFFILIYARKKSIAAKDIFFFLLIFNAFNYLFSTNSYVCDDILISCRTADNFVNGYGLRWNTSERVQSFTNPLWLLLIIILYYPLHFFAEPHAVEKFWWIVILLSYSFSFLLTHKLAVYFLRRQNYWLLIAVFLLLFSSRAFVDFICSGMENPLSFVLLAWFYKDFLSRKQEKNVEFTKLYLIASLAFLNRQDNVLFCIFPILFLLYEQYQHNKKISPIFKSLLIGFAPAYCWLIFAVVYYGFPFPNTYYAKMELGYLDIIFKQSINFFYMTFLRDTATVIIILLGQMACFFFRDKKYIISSLSIILFLVYVFFTGGDFMGTRFFSMPVVVSIIILSICLSDIYFIQRIVINKFIVVLAISYNFLAYYAPIKYSFHYRRILAEYGKRDPYLFYLQRSCSYLFFDKAFYYKASNILFYQPNTYPFFKFLLINDINECIAVGKQGDRAIMGGGIGMIGICRGKNCSVVDSLALAEPLLARLPAKDLQNGFFPGHVLRKMPKGLLASHQQNTNLLADKALAAYYDKILLISRGEIFSWQRFRYIWLLNTSERKYKKPYF